MRVHQVDEHAAEDKQISVGNDWVEGILKERFEPSPEQPFHLWNDEKRNENGSQKHGDRGGDEAECDCEQKLSEVVKAEARSSAGGREGGFQAEPHDQDQCETAKQIQSERLKGVRMRSEQVAQELKKIIHRTRHRHLPSVLLCDY